MSVALLLGLLASSAAALPQQGSGSSSTSVIQSLSGTVVGRISSVGPAVTTASTSLPSGFTAPPTRPTSYQNTSGIPSTPISQNPGLPSYAIDYAPVMYLHQNESYWPSAWDVHLSYVFPWENYVPLNNVPNPLTLENLNFTTSYSLYLSMENPTQEPRPAWLYSEYGKPDANGLSASNVTIIAVNKSASIAPGYVDVFYFYLYSFNEGDNVGGQTYGNHISDIEYTMIRFLNGVPSFMFLSQHQDGQAYEFQAIQKEASGRPIAYVAQGGHANYPVAGTFQLVPGLVGLLQDHTTAGYRWDTALNYNGYWYSQVDGFVTAGGSNASTQPNGPPGIGYLQQTGKWGNQGLPASDPEQAIIFGQPRWSDGGTGPIDPSKSLPRTWLCVQSNCPANASLPATDLLQAGQTAPASAGIKSIAGISMLFMMPFLAALSL